MKTSHEMAQSVLKRQKKILRRRSNILTAFGATGGTAAIIAVFALIVSLIRVKETQPVITVSTNSTVTSISETAPLEEKTDPLSILQYRTNEEGEREVYVNLEEWEKIEDFDLFRKYFFGAWEITEGQSIELSDMGGSLPFIIDDSEKSFFSTSYWYRLYKGYFYRIGENILAFAMNSKDAVHLFWIDINSPVIMYNDFFHDSEDGSLSHPNTTGYNAIYTYSKSDIPVNEPLNGYLSIFRLYEIAREYGIDFDMLIKLQYEVALENSPDYMVDTVNLLHDDCLQSYPVYLLSEESDKLILKTTVGNFYIRDVKWDITYTIEKINGRWIRTADPPEGEFSINSDLISELGMTFGELSEKYGCEPKGAYNSYSMEKGYGIYVWKSPDGSVYEDMEQAGGCNMIDGVRVKLLLSGVSYPLSFDTLEEKGFTPISIGNEPGMDDCFWASFSHSDYEGITFTFYTKEYGIIGENESCIVTAAGDEAQNDEETSAFKAVAEEAAEAYLSNDRQTLLPYLYDPDYETGLAGMSGSIIGNVKSGELILPTETAPPFEADKEYKAVYRFTLEGEEMLFYLDLELINTNEGWKVKAIDFQG